ncbi:protein SAWADEE HOMEODOMAIN HOMOLOG 1 isoform X2 [Quercus suber]
MEKLLKESGEQLLNQEICQRIAKSFNRSSGRAGKPIVKWNEVYSWFQNQQQNESAASKNVPVLPKASPSNGRDENLEMPKEDSSKAGERIPDTLEAGERIPDLLELEFEARSSKDGAW